MAELGKMPKKLPDLNKQLISAMREDSNKWDFIVRIIKQEQEGVLQNILSKVGDGGQALSDKQLSDLITWHQFLEYVVGLPELILDESKPKPVQKEPDFETYPLKKVRDEITE